MSHTHTFAAAAWIKGRTRGHNIIEIDAIAYKIHINYLKLTQRRLLRLQRAPNCDSIMLAKKGEEFCAAGWGVGELVCPNES